MSMGGGSSAGAAPAESEYSRTLAGIANQRQADYETRFMPLEAAYRSSVENLNSDSAYAGAMAKGQQHAGAMYGNAAQQAAQALAAGGGTGSLLSGLSSATNANADAVFGGYTGQRGNFLNQAQGVSKLGVGVMDDTIKGFKTISEADTSRINSNYANQVGDAVARQNSNTAMLSGLTKLGSTYYGYKKADDLAAFNNNFVGPRRWA